MKNKSPWTKVFSLPVFLCIILSTALNAGVISVPACAAKPCNNSQSNLNIWTSAPNGFAFFSTGIFPVYIPVYLPNGVSLKKFTAIVYDSTGGTHHISAEIIRTNMATGLSENMTSVDTSVPGVYDHTSLSTMMISNKKVNNISYSYALRLTLDNSVDTKVFYGALIYY